MKKTLIILAIYSILISVYAIISEFFRVGSQASITLIVPFIHLITLAPIIVFSVLIIIRLKKRVKTKKTSTVVSFVQK
jgi:prolipoprotein diacylglyceryltransferase